MHCIIMDALYHEYIIHILLLHTSCMLYRYKMLYKINDTCMCIQYIRMYIMCVVYSLLLQSARARGTPLPRPLLPEEVQTQLPHWCTAAQIDGEACSIYHTRGGEQGTINRRVTYSTYNYCITLYLIFT